jgi:hypothetical protein
MSTHFVPCLSLSLYICICLCLSISKWLLKIKCVVFSYNSRSVGVISVQACAVDSDIFVVLLQIS